MDYHSGRLTITSDDVAHVAAQALRAIRQRFRPQTTPTDPASCLWADAQQELSAAQQLLTWNQHRAAGAVAGVALELYLKYVACRHGLDVRPYATIAQVQDMLRYAGVLTRAECRWIGKLAAIRNQCVHARPEPLRRAAVEQFVQGIAQLIQAAGTEHGHV